VGILLLLALHQLFNISLLLAEVPVLTLLPEVEAVQVDC